jgi:hypothetical protein
MKESLIAALLLLVVAILAVLVAFSIPVGPP